MDRWNRECLALILQVWRKELELKPPKTMAVSKTTKGPPKGSSGGKPSRHSALKQIYGNCPACFTAAPRSASPQIVKQDLITLGKPPFR